MRISNDQGRVISLQAQNAGPVTPSDSADLDHVSTLYIGGAGDIKVTMYGNNAVVTFVGVQKGSTLPILVKRVWSTDTTAANIVALW